jgi:hypothetical protein
MTNSVLSTDDSTVRSVLISATSIGMVAKTVSWSMFSSFRGLKEFSDWMDCTEIFIVKNGSYGYLEKS